MRWSLLVVSIGVGSVFAACSGTDSTSGPVAGSAPIVEVTSLAASTTVAPPTTVAPTTVPTATPPTTIETACQSDARGVEAANALTVLLPSGLWRVIPESTPCVVQRGPVDRVRLEQRDLVTGEVLASRTLTMAEIHEVDGGTGALRLAMYPSRYWNGLGLAGVAGRRVVLQTATAVIGVDVDTGAIASVALDDPGRVVGVVGSTILAINADSVDRADLQTGTLETLTTPGVDIRDFTGSPDGMWFCSTDPSQILRIDAEGGIHRLDQFVGTLNMCYLQPAPGSLWAVVQVPSVDEQAGLVRLDPTDGHVLATAERREAPQGNFIAFAGADGYLALLGDWAPDNTGYYTQVVANWWWVDNEGRITELRPPPGVTVLGVAGGRIVGYGLDYQIVSYAVADLMPSS